jgi:DNA-binding response OmpR family regulator
VPELLVATDADAVVDAVRAAVGGPDTIVRSVATGAAVGPSVATQTPDLVVLDLQIGNMGGMATCLDLRLEAGAGRLPEVPVLMLLDRRADVFLARRSGADGWVVKPLDPLRLGRAVRTILAGGTYEDPTGMPAVTVPPPTSVR